MSYTLSDPAHARLSGLVERLEDARRRGDRKALADLRYWADRSFADEFGLLERHVDRLDPKTLFALLRSNARAREYVACLAIRTALAEALDPGEVEGSSGARVFELTLALFEWDCSAREDESLVRALAAIPAECVPSERRALWQELCAMATGYSSGYR